MNVWQENGNMSEEEMDILDELTIEMKDLCAIYDEIFDGKGVEEYTKEELLKFIDDMIILNDRIVAILRTHDHRLDVIERLMQVFDPEVLKEITGKLNEPNFDDNRMCI